MEFLFLNPWAMVAGGAMVSSPILIHLINRMRFRRIRWAAMEFLLKAQRRNRRRLIIEQLILLLLRILLVLLAAIIFARFIGQETSKAGKEADAKIGTLHVVLLDDSLSMRDQNPKKKDQVAKDAFAKATDWIQEFATKAAEEQSQELRILTVSNPQQLHFSAMLNEPGGMERDRLIALAEDRLQPTLIHLSPLEGVKQAAEQFKDVTGKKKSLHVISDFREKDWGPNVAGKAEVMQVLEGLAKAGVNVTLIDAAEPKRDPATSRVDAHGNHAITELRPEKRIAPGGSVVPFFITIQHHGRRTLDEIGEGGQVDDARQIFLQIFVDGKEDFTVSRPYDAPKPGELIRHSFDLLFDDPPGEVQFHRISVNLQATDEQAGLLEDNWRHTVIEVRKRVPVLIIDGAYKDDPASRPDLGDRVGGDLRSIKNVLESTKGAEVVHLVAGTVEDLKQPDLDRRFAAIYLLNVENLKGAKDEAGKGEGLPLERLKEFVRKGGSVAFFMGDKVDLNYYNKVLYGEAEREGLFPVPLANSMTARLTDPQILEMRKSNAPKIYIVDSSHPITKGLFPSQHAIPDLIIAQHAQAKDRFDWAWQDPADETKTKQKREEPIKELIMLASLKPVDDGVRGFIQKNILDALPSKDPRYAKYKPLLDKHDNAIRQAMQETVTQPDRMDTIASALDKLLTDIGDKPSEKDNVSLIEFWALDSMKDLKARIQKFRSDQLYGSPLVVTHKYGKGNVVAFMTTAGTKWSGWPGGRDGGAAAFSFPMIIIDLQRFLARGGSDPDHTLGETLTVEVDEKLYKDTAQRVVQVWEGKKLSERRDADQSVPQGFVKEPPITVPVKDGKYVFSFENKKNPGVQIIRLSPRQAGAAAEDVIEERWLVSNIDVERESDLQRIYADEMLPKSIENKSEYGTIGWSTTPKAAAKIDKKEEKKKFDLTDGVWPFLIVFLALVAEHAMAVHLSHHGSKQQAAPAAA